MIPMIKWLLNGKGIQETSDFNLPSQNKIKIPHDMCRVITGFIFWSLLSLSLLSSLLSLSALTSHDH